MELRFERKLYMGIVEDNYDPNRKGRIKVRVQSLYNMIELNDIPFASPFMDLTGKEYKIPSIGKIVNILFLTNNFYDPYYIYSENYNVNLQNKLDALSEDEYVNFIALLFDERTQIHATSEELTIDHLYNKITINKESINHELKDNTQLLNLGDRKAKQDAVLGNHWFNWMDKFVNTLLQPTSLLGNQSAPIIRPQIDALLQEYQAIKHTFVSNHVKIVDNNQVTKLERDPKTDTSKEDKNLIDNTFKQDINIKNLQNKIEEENKKSCQNEISSRPSSQLPQPETEEHENESDFAPNEGSYEQRIINGQIYTVTDTNREKLDNFEKSLEAEKELDQHIPSGKFKGQSYYIDDQYNQKSKVYNPEEIDKIEITMPNDAGQYNRYLRSSEPYDKKIAFKLQNKLVIDKYYPPIKKLIDSAKSDGIDITLNDAFRKFEDQMKLRIQNAPQNKKNDENFLTSASSTQFKPYTGRPGYSRHHFGVAFDISTAGGKNAAYKWLEKNGLNFGFIRTVKSETWHWEYKPWDIEGVNIRSWDKYAIVPKGHSTWNDDTDEPQQQIVTKQTKHNKKDNKPNDIKEC